MIGRITAPAIPYLVGIIVALLVALGVSLRYNAVQWADARAASAAHEQALKLALSEGRAQVLARNVKVADELAASAEQARLDMLREQQDFIAAQRKRDREYWASVQKITLSCGPGQDFVDAFNDAVQP